MKVHGKCLCKKVSFSFKAKAKEFDVCHCSMCRAWGGGPSFNVESLGEVLIEGLDSLSIYESSEWAERGFCQNCGTHLFYRLKDKSLNFCNFNLGAVEAHEDYKFIKQIFIDNKPDHYSFSNKTICMTESEVLEAFGSGNA